MSAPFGLIVRACFFAFVVQIVTGWALLGLHMPMDSGSFIFWMLVATFLPVTVAADMGYLKGRAESLASGKGQPMVDVDSNQRPEDTAANGQQSPGPTSPDQRRGQVKPPSD
jgi:hypothetical protein